MKYQSQKVAYWYFLAAMALFGIQVLGGLLAGWIYVAPNFLSELLPFNVIRDDLRGHAVFLQLQVHAGNDPQLPLPFRDDSNCLAVLGIDEFEHERSLTDVGEIDVTSANQIRWHV